MSKPAPATVSCFDALPQPDVALVPWAYSVGIRRRTQPLRGV